MSNNKVNASATRCKASFRHSLLVLSVAALSIAHAFPASAVQARSLMRDFIGLNGHTVQFKPELYQPVCRLVRDYHPVEWDLNKTTQELPAFPLAKNGVD